MRWGSWLRRLSGILQIKNLTCYIKFKISRRPLVDLENGVGILRPYVETWEFFLDRFEYMG